MSHRIIHVLAAGLIIAGAALAPAHANIPYNPAQYDAKLITLIGLDDLLVPVPVTFDPPGDHLVYHADFNGDGITDLFLQGMGNNDSSYILLGHRNSVGAIEYRSINQSWNNGHLGQQWTANVSNIYVGDYNGDGRADIIVESKATGGTNAMLYSNGQGQFTQLYISWTNAGSNGGALPVIAGTLPAAEKINETGAYTYSIPIEVPPARAGLAPQLSLQYSSQQGNDLVGMGWSIGGLSSVTRCPRTLAQDNQVSATVNFDANDRFCVDGQRLMVVSGGYGTNGAEYRTEIESYTRYISYDVDPGQNNGPERFEAWTKAGLVLEYGTTADSRVEAQPSRPYVRVWALNKIRDKSGNEVNFYYSEDAATGEYYPVRVDYAPNRSVRFEYVGQTRPDVMRKYIGGSKITVSKRLSNIKTYLKEGGRDYLVRDYRLTYDIGPGTGRSRLKSVQACAASECLPATTLSWNDGVMTFLSSAPAWGEPGLTKNILKGDFNGDGKEDIVHLPGDGKAYLLLSKRDGASFDPVIIIQKQAPFRSSEFTRVADFNGDGRSDLITVVNPSTGPGNSNDYTVFLSTGNNFTNIPLGTTSTSAVYTSDYIGDFNGDGKADILRFKPEGTTGLLFTSHVRLSNGSGFGIEKQWGAGHQSFSPSTTSPSPQYFQLGDFNGDGRTDVLEAKGTNPTQKFYIRYASAISENFQSGVVWTPDSNLLPGHSNRYVVDLNSDGLSDLIVFGNGNSYVRLSSGAGAVGDNVALSGEHFSPISTKFADVNGDGIIDIIQFEGSSSFFWLGTGNGFKARTWLASNHTAFTEIGDYDGDGRADILGVYDSWVGNGVPVVWKTNEAFPDMLAKVTDGLGSQTIISYSPVTDGGVHALGSTYGAASTSFYGPLYNVTGQEWGAEVRFKLKDISGPMYVVKTLNTSNGIGGNFVYNYRYSGARVSLDGRGFQGFASITAHDLYKNIYTTTDYLQDFPYIRLENQVRQTYANNTIYSITNVWNKKLSDASINSPYLQKETEIKSELNGAFYAVVTREVPVSDMSQYGSPRKTVITQSGDGKTYTETSNNIYYLGQENVNGNGITINLNDWHLLGHPTSRTVSRTVPKQRAESPNYIGATQKSWSYAYYPTTGRLQTETFEPNNVDLKLVNTYVYDGFGNKIQTTQSGPGLTQDRITNLVFGVDGLFPEWYTNPLGQIEHRAHDASHGSVKTVTDVNGLTTEWRYDGFGRKVSEYRPDGTSTTWSYNACSAPACTSLPYSAMRVDEASSGKAPVYAYFDVLGRKLRTQTYTHDNVASWRDVKYDEKAR